MSCLFQAHRIMIDFFPIPYSFNAMLKPVSLSCGQSGCLVCLRQLTKSTANPKCPMCRREFQASTISVNIALDLITSELAVECQSQGCDWKGKYARARAHQKHCPNLLVKCSNVGCSFREARGKMPQNEKSFSKRWWSDSVGFVAGARTIPVHKRHKTVSLRLRGNISQVIMLLILVTLLVWQAGFQKKNERHFR